MTVSSETNKVIYAGDGNTIVFSTSFLFSANNEVSVVLVDADGNENAWVEGTQYTLTGAGTNIAGDVTVDTSPTNYTPQVGETLVIRLAPAFLQQTAFPRGGVISPVDIEASLDNLVRIDLRQNELLDRTLILPITTSGVSTALPEPQSLSLFRWNELETALENVSAADIVTTEAFSNFAADTFTDGVDYTAGTTTQLTLTASPGVINNTQVYFDGVYQEKTEYSLAANVITFTSPIPVGVTGVEVVHGRATDVLAPSTREIQIGDGLKTAYTLANAYEPSNGTLHVYVNGVRQEVNYGYVETNANTVTFDSAPGNGDVVLFLVNPFVNQTTAAASSVSYNNAASGLTGTNVQAAIDELLPKTDATSYGFYTTVNATDPTNDIDISAGQCWDTTRTVFIQGSAMTKQGDATWAAGTNAGFLDTGAIASNEGYHIYAMINDVDGSVDYIMSLSGTWAGVTKPTNYTKGQIVGYAYRDTAWVKMIWSGNWCNYEDGRGGFNDTTITDATYETYELKGIPRNSLGLFTGYVDNTTPSQFQGMYVRHTDASALPLNPASFVLFHNNPSSSDPVTALGSTFSFLVDSNRQMQVAVIEGAGSVTAAVNFLGFQLPDRLEATS